MDMNCSSADARSPRDAPLRLYHNSEIFTMRGVGKDVCAVYRGEKQMLLLRLLQIKDIVMGVMVVALAAAAICAYLVWRGRAQFLQAFGAACLVVSVIIAAIAQFLPYRPATGGPKGAVIIPLYYPQVILTFVGFSLFVVGYVRAVWQGATRTGGRP